MIQPVPPTAALEGLPVPKVDHVDLVTVKLLILERPQYGDPEPKLIRAYLAGKRTRRRRGPMRV